jgi:hypothetical protein
VWPEDFVISPDPALPGTPTGGTPIGAGDVLIVAALADPAGSDRDNERVTLLNTTAAAIELAGWRLVDGSGGRMALTGTIGAGATLRVTASRAVPLGNQGDSLLLLDEAGATIDQVAYSADQVRPGRTIAFGRLP